MCEKRLANRTCFLADFTVPFQNSSLFLVLICFIIFTVKHSPCQESGNTVYRADSEIKRLTYSGEHWVGYPAISDDGKMITFLEEIRDTSTVTGEIHTKKIVKAISSDGTDQRILFTDSTVHAPAPHQDSYLFIGTKPPRISGNGQKVIFTISLSAPADRKDHLLAMVNIDGSGFRTIAFKNEALSSVDWKNNKFESDAWERVANYDISDDGNLIACVLKGHFGPVGYGNPSGILVVNSDGSDQRTLLTPHFENDQWAWNEFPRKPLTGGGWAFAMSGDGKRLLFGAQASEETSDYDLYTMDVDGMNPRRITSFRDRLFSFADISDDGNRIVFFYSGKRGDGIGTYVMNSDGTGLRRLTSHIVNRIDYDDTADFGDKVYFKAPSGGVVMEVDQEYETLLFDRSTPGYVRSGVEMDFPSYPSFWAPDFVSRDGHTVLLSGVPKGKDLLEVYVLTTGDLKKTILICPYCGNKMDPSWKYCPYDGTKLE